MFQQDRPSRYEVLDEHDTDVSLPLLLHVRLRLLSKTTTDFCRAATSVRVVVVLLVEVVEVLVVVVVVAVVVPIGAVVETEEGWSLLFPTCSTVLTLPSASAKSSSQSL